MVTGKLIKPFAKKALTPGVSQTGEKVGKKAADEVVEKSGKLIRKMLSKGGTKKTAKTTKAALKLSVFYIMFRSPEYVQRNELVQFRLQDSISTYSYT